MFSLWCHYYILARSQSREENSFVIDKFQVYWQGNRISYGNERRYIADFVSWTSGNGKFGYVF